MATILMPVRADLDAYGFVMDLEGTKYGFRFRYNERLAAWVMDVTTSAGVNLVCGRPVQTNVDLLGQYTVEGLPPGQFMAQDETGNEADPTRENFGGDVVLLYRESTG